MDDNEQLREVRGDVKMLLTKVAVIQEAVEKAGELCPYRELIAKSANNSQRLGVLEKVVYGGTLLTIFVSVLLKIVGWI